MRKKFGLFFSFLGFILLFFVLSKACVYNFLYPFAFAMFFALAWANQKIWILIPAYLIGYIANFPNFEGIIIAVCTVTALAIPYYIHVLAKRPMPKWELFVYAFLSQTAYVVFAVLDGVNPIYIAVNLVLGLLYLFICISIFEPLILRGLFYKLTVFELVCGGIVLLSIGDGLASCDIYEFSVLKLFVSFLLLSISYTSNVKYTLSFASIMALGTLIRNNNPIFVAPFILWALAISAFRTENKIFPALALALTEIASVYYFNLYYSATYITFLPVFISAFVFVLIPKKIYKNLSVIFSTNTDRLAIKNVVNRNRDILQRRLNNLGEVFYEMNIVFKKLIKKGLSEDEVKNMIYGEIKNSICKTCPEYHHCHRTFGQDTQKLFEELVMLALQRGKITLLDFPSYLSSRCGKMNHLINEFNTLTNQYKAYKELTGNIDTSKMLISDQLEGISGIMKTLAKDVDTLISFDSSRENRLIEELSSNNIICTDAVVYERDARTTMATLVVREEDSNKLKLQEITSKICGGKMVVYEIYPTEKAGLLNVNLKTAPRFDCVFGLATYPKTGNNISGDSHSIERLDGDKFMFAICDGMGHGEKASEKSETSVALIENFYKAGFDNEIVLTSVNRLLNLEKDDIFSSLDICTIDLKNGIADFVKMGAANSFVRGEDGCQIITGESLPLGVVDNVQTLTKKIVLRNKDFIIICSDGVNDSFSSDKEMKDFILTIKTANPQEYANAILDRALKNNNGFAIDDMTIIVVKII